MPYDLADFAVKHWYCPSCHVEHRSKGPKLARHACPSHFGLDLPLVLEGRKAGNKVNYREDYLKSDLCSARDDNGDIIMNVSTEFDDGNELTVFMPCAVTSIEALGVK